MSAREIDYWDLRVGIEEAIQAHEDLAGLRVVKEPHASPSPEELPAALVFMTERSTPEERQRLAAGTRADHRIVFSVWVLTYSLDAMEAAVRQRDRIMAKVEVALLRDRRLGGRLLKDLTLEAGDILHAQEEESEARVAFSTSIETRVVVHDYTSTA